MADQKIRISELPESTSTQGLMTIGVNSQNESVKVPLGSILSEYDAGTAAAKKAAQDAAEAKEMAGSAQQTADSALNNSQSAKEQAAQAEGIADGAEETANNALTLAKETSTKRFISFVDAANIKMQSTTQEGQVVFVKSAKVFALRVVCNGVTSYYSNWSDADQYLNATRSAVLSDKLFICNGLLYSWNETEGVLEVVGNDPDEIKEIEDLITPRLFINATKLLNLAVSSTLDSVRTMIANLSDAARYMMSGVVLTFLGNEGWEAWQWVGGTWSNSSHWKKFGGSASVGNCYNVTNDVPISGYYDLESAINAAYSHGYTSVGLQITFSIAKGSWKTYQYVGTDNTEANFKNENNWVDLAGLSAGAETLINVDALCGPCTSADFYTLEYAIAAIKSLAQASGINYEKGGLVITYKVGDNKWETKQFNGVESDFGEASLWSDFGGAGSKVETKSDPQKDGEDAFSTGGAYEHLPADLAISYEDNVLKASLVNEAGETIGTEKQFVIQGGGGGGSTATIVTFTPEQSPFYAKAGGKVILKAAVRSVTTQNGQEQLNTIETVELYDRDTSTILQTYRLNKASSADSETFDFEFDLSSYFTQAGSRKFKFIAYDDTDHSGSRNLNVTAVDITIKSEQTLNYTPSTILTVGGSTKSLPMYRFPNNASDQGILCYVEIYLDNQWKELGTATINDTYSHSVSINPQNCLGKVLTHGAYPLRIHGVDVSSGVVGNYLYTTVMCVDLSSTLPIVATRWFSETKDAIVQQYENITLDFAAYTLNATSVDVQIEESAAGETQIKQTTSANRSKTYTYIQRVSGFATDGSVTINLKAKTTGANSQTASFKVQGSLLDIEEVTSQLMFNMEMASRSNADADKTITDGGYTLSVSGSNYSTNGFVKDTYGTSEYGTESDQGVMALRIAENVKGSLNYAPFNQAAIETNGLALQFKIRTKNIADDEARLISCISNGFGFYVTGKKVVFTTDNEATVTHTIDAALADDSVTDVCIVIEPTSQSPYGGIGVMKMYFDGELIGTAYYDAGTISRHATPITFDGTEGDLYLYNIRAWETYFGFEQDFNNYLLNMSDSDSMITEYDFNQVMASQAAEGKSATNRPQAAKLYERGIAYFVECKNASTADTKENYPDYIESLKGDKKTSALLDIYAYFPDRPWQNFKALGVKVTNQGTTSSMRPIKNIKMKFKGSEMSLINPASMFSGEDLVQYNLCAEMIAKGRVQVKQGGLFTNIITVKVDYSESGGANNGASTQLYNELQRVLGKDYMTPAQVYYTGTYELNTSIDSVPCAFFRTDQNSEDATSPANGYFHAKGNWNFDKGDPDVFGFEDVEGYNEGTLNYGEFTELIADRDQTLVDFAASLDKKEWDQTKVYVLSEFCGPNHKVFRYQSDAWTETTGAMTFTNNKWRITGDVVNPVECYELRAYNSFDWFQGCNSVDDLLAPDSKGAPIWLTYFESRYPDNDDLNTAYSDGRKVPYTLYKWLKWCQDCNQHLTEADGNITLDGATVSGTKVNRLKKFKHELHNEANVHSMICYHIFTDYFAAVDQRSKNMMIGFYLDTDGKVRMYLNHLYDGDTILGSDNDCGLTIPAELDPNNDPKGYYQGHDSVLFTQLAASDYIWLKDYSSDADTSDTTKTTTVATIAARMRSIALTSGLKPFSPDGIEKYWITDRLSKWPKLVSSYDGIRKYIEHSVSDDNYFYALHGLSIQRLRDYVVTRFLYRDGFYQCGDTYSSVFQMRATGTNMTVTIKAAKDGYFGIGVDQAMSARESVHLNAGESVTLHSGNTNLGSGVMLYIYGANRIAELDIRNATPKQQGWDISNLTLIKKLIIGGSGYSPATNNGDELSTLNLGQLPFLEELDIRNVTSITNITATYCPRLIKVLAEGSHLQTITLAETSPIETLHLPATVNNLSFVNLPLLSYPHGGLEIAGLTNVKRLQLTGCPNIDTYQMMKDVVDDGATTNLTDIFIDGLDITADASILLALRNAGTKGIGSDLDGKCDGLVGRWILTSLIEDTDLNDLQNYFPELNLNNTQFTLVQFDDTVSDPANIVNLDNNTSGDDYLPSGHISRIRAKLIPVKGKLNTTTGKWEGVKISESNYRQLPNGDDFDYTDSLGEGFDVMMRCPAFWYKGINDFKNQKKYIAWSSLNTEPLSTARNINRKTLSDIISNRSKVIMMSQITEGVSTLESEGVLADTSNYNVYQIDVEGMKQIRWPGLNSASIGACFLNSEGVIIEKYNMAVSNTLFDFVEGDYIFIDVPSGAKTFAFTSAIANNDLEAIAVDSSEIEAIEPDWVHNDAWLGGVYEASVDSLTQLRSVSGATVKVGTGTATTSTEWIYDADGNPTNTPLNKMNYTQKDFQNLAKRRGSGYQLFDYEMSKLMAILFYSMRGNRDGQLLCGYGQGSGGTTGYKDTIGNTDSIRATSNNGNKVLGFESFMACTYEWMDNIGLNIVDYPTFMKNYGVATSKDQNDGIFHIYDPITKTERTVLGLKGQSDAEVVRTKHGRFCDIIASKAVSDSTWAKYYCDLQNCNSNTGRVVGRASYYAYAIGGLAYAYSYYASSVSSSCFGSRLAFRGKIAISGE